MFVLSEKNIGIALSEINKIIITYFSSKSDLFNIYDNNFTFNENIIPLITSILEFEPVIYNYKTYNCIDTITTIKQYQNIIKTKSSNSSNSSNSFNSSNSSNSELLIQNTYPSFYYDVNTLENVKINITKKTLLNTLIDENDQQIIRIYKEHLLSDANITNDYTQNILNESEYKKISWEFDWGSFDIIIPLKTKQDQQQSIINTVNYQITINIIEDNKIIQSRLIKINDILQKINKIKSVFIINE
jgi:hypothetical protein